MHYIQDYTFKSTSVNNIYSCEDGIHTDNSSTTLQPRNKYKNCGALSRE